MRPRSADTSEFACTKRKMLSMKRMTSFPSSSRKYSATVSAARPTRALADAAEHRHAAVLLGDVVDELQDDHGLPHAGAAEEPDLPAPLVGGEEVDDLDPGLEGLHLRLLVGEGRRLAMDGIALRGRDRPALVDRLADHVHDAAEGRLADRHLDAVARVAHLLAAGEPVGRVHGDRAHGLLAQVP